MFKLDFESVKLAVIFESSMLYVSIPARQSTTAVLWTICFGETFVLETDSVKDNRMYNFVFRRVRPIIGRIEQIYFPTGH